jgi:hypothetical protein
VLLYYSSFIYLLSLVEEGERSARLTALHLHARSQLFSFFSYYICMFPLGSRAAAAFNLIFPARDGNNDNLLIIIILVYVLLMLHWPQKHILLHACRAAHANIPLQLHACSKGGRKEQ